ncbi:hypothetical protein JXZ92_01665 [Mycoplasma sp. CSL10137]|uniref:hypothetical protein n=1 Tax=unclassified Mycoplasma TaxID=2683645 RepID=UPI00197C5A7B|nr:MULTISPECIES: hypothetical protein [unclassified Mycoplasma]MBN4083528.1 hypothetical protein [Mycoplasma sp. CSL10137]MBN4084542.1 hypothetical protein [Mycoplasma sp. CSL10166]MBU4693020.1 hypothetical protein [Mycoplasma sp. CSL7491-lung]
MNQNYSKSRDEIILMILSNKENKELNKEMKWFKKNIDGNFKPILDYDIEFSKSMKNLNFSEFNYSKELTFLIDESFKLKLELSKNYSNLMNGYDFDENLKINPEIIEIINKISKK